MGFTALPFHSESVLKLPSNALLEDMSSESGSVSVDEAEQSPCQLMRARSKGRSRIHSRSPSRVLSTSTLLSASRHPNSMEAPSSSIPAFGKHHYARSVRNGNNCISIRSDGSGGQREKSLDVDSQVADSLNPNYVHLREISRNQWRRSIANAGILSFDDPFLD